VWRHQIRWARTYRTVQPLGWMLAIVTHATTWAVLLWLVTAGSPAASWMLLGVFGGRLLALGALMYDLRERETPRSFWLLPLKDLAVSAIWVASWLGRTVEWSGQRFRIGPDGRLEPLVTPPVSARFRARGSSPDPPHIGARRPEP
jgi:ceramide glucosyltransferase